MIDISNIVKVKLDVSVHTNLLGSYNTIAYIVPEQTPQIQDGTRILSTDNLQEKGIQQNSDLATNIQMFFANGGYAVVLYTYKKPGEVNQYASSAKNLINDIINNSNGITATNKDGVIESNVNSYGLTYIVLSNALQLDSTLVKEFDKVASSLAAPNTKRIVITQDLHSSNDYQDTNVIIFATDLKSHSNAESGKLDIALLLGSYYTGIDLDSNESIKDLCYTPANIVGYVSGADGTYTAVTHDNIDNDMYTSLNEKDINFVGQVGNRTMIFGGNNASGVGIDTDFGCICIQNDIANALIEVMTNKQYLTASGLNNVVSRIQSLLLRYQTNGYVETDSVYTGNTINRVYNNRKFNIINTGDTLMSGYSVVAIPMSVITQADRQERKFTPIYIILQTAKGARVVEVTGIIE